VLLVINFGLGCIICVVYKMWKRQPVQKLEGLQNEEAILLQNPSSSPLNATADPDGWVHYKYSAISVILFLCDYFYFTIATHTLEIFHCSKDPVTGKSFMTTAPWIQCNLSATPYIQLFIIAMISCLFYVIGIPVLYLALYCWKKKSFGDSDVKKWLGFLYSNYNQDHLWWEFVMIARRVCIAFVIAIIPEKSEALAILVMLILTLSLLLQVFHQPFLVRLENIVDYSTCFVVLFSFFSVAMMTSCDDLPDSVSGVSVLTWILFILNAILVVFSLIVLALPSLQKLGNKCCKKRIAQS